MQHAHSYPFKDIQAGVQAQLQQFPFAGIKTTTAAPLLPLTLLFDAAMYNQCTRETLLEQLHTTYLAQLQQVNQDAVTCFHEHVQCRLTQALRPEAEAESKKSCEVSARVLAVLTDTVVCRRSGPPVRLVLAYLHVLVKVLGNCCHNARAHDQSAETDALAGTMRAGLFLTKQCLALCGGSTAADLFPPPAPVLSSLGVGMTGDRTGLVQPTLRVCDLQEQLLTLFVGILDISEALPLVRVGVLDVIEAILYLKY